jgi:hypothetical protein
MSVTERFRWNRVAPGDAGFRKFRISASAGQNPASCWPNLFSMRDLARIGASSF